MLIPAKSSLASRLVPKAVDALGGLTQHRGNTACGCRPAETRGRMVTSGLLLVGERRKIERSRRVTNSYWLD